MPKFEVNTVEREVTQVVQEKEYVIRLSEEEAREIADLCNNSSVCPGGLDGSWFPTRNREFWCKSKEIFRPLIKDFPND